MDSQARAHPRASRSRAGAGRRPARAGGECRQYRHRRRYLRSSRCDRSADRVRRAAGLYRLRRQHGRDRVVLRGGRQPRADERRSLRLCRSGVRPVRRLHHGRAGLALRRAGIRGHSSGAGRRALRVRARACRPYPARGRHRCALCAARGGQHRGRSTGRAARGIHHRRQADPASGVPCGRRVSRAPGESDGRRVLYGGLRPRDVPRHLRLLRHGDGARGERRGARAGALGADRIARRDGRRHRDLHPDPDRCAGRARRRPRALDHAAVRCARRVFAGSRQLAAGRSGDLDVGLSRGQRAQRAAPAVCHGARRLPAVGARGDPSANPRTRGGDHRPSRDRRGAGADRHVHRARGAVDARDRGHLRARLCGFSRAAQARKSRPPASRCNSAPRSRPRSSASPACCGSPRRRPRARRSRSRSRLRRSARSISRAYSAGSLRRRGAR